jgi:hypothetical protein
MSDELRVVHRYVTQQNEVGDFLARLTRLLVGSAPAYGRVPAWPQANVPYRRAQTAMTNAIAEDWRFGWRDRFAPEADE